MKRRLLYLVILVIAVGLFYGGVKWQEKEGQPLMVPQRVIHDFKGNPKTRPTIEWLNDKEFALYKGCGTECVAVYLFNINNFQRKFYYGVEHTWSPNKKYVFAYHYANPAGHNRRKQVGELPLCTKKVVFTQQWGIFKSRGLLVSGFFEARPYYSEAAWGGTGVAGF